MRTETREQRAARMREWREAFEAGWDAWTARSRPIRDRERATRDLARRRALEALARALEKSRILGR
jgi:hypothetical protein